MNPLLPIAVLLGLALSPAERRSRARAVARQRITSPGRLARKLRRVLTGKSLDAPVLVASGVYGQEMDELEGTAYETATFDWPGHGDVKVVRDGYGVNVLFWIEPGRSGLLQNVERVSTSRLASAMRAVRPGEQPRKAKKEKFNRRQLEIGTRVEMEHTKSKRVARRIAKDHLREIPDYYTRLLKMEKAAGVKA